MDIKLVPEQEESLKNYLQELLKTSLSTITSDNKPFVNRESIARYFGVSPTTITNWVKIGCPYIDIEGRKLYGKEAITKWLEEHTKKAL